MTLDRGFELPRDRREAHDRSIRLAWITIGYLITALVGIYITAGASQAMKAVFVEDLLSLIPPIGFLMAERVRHRDPDEEHPFGYHRSVSIGYLTSSLALLTMGSLILFDSVSKLVTMEHPPIGLVQPWGEPVWAGWFMIAALLYSALPAVVLGRMKIPLAHTLHDKALYADAKMNKADWLSAVAGIAGILGIGLGLWWADAVAAIVISLDIAHDGYGNLRVAVADLMDARPTLVDYSAADPLPARIRTELISMDWVADARVRVRDEGHVFFAEAEVVPSDDRDLLQRLDEAQRALRDLDWRLYHMILMPVTEISAEPDVDGVEQGASDS